MNKLVTDYGAVPDGSTMNTQAIQKAIDICHEAGGGVIAFPAGTFRTGSLTLKSNVTLHLQAGCRLLGSDQLEDYRDLSAPGFEATKGPENSSCALLLAVEAENIGLTGPGIIDGAGLAFYDPASADASGKLAKPPTARPRAVMFYKCRNVRIADSTYQDSPCWTFWLMKCEDVQVHRIRIRGNRRMRNNDGIDIDACRNVTVSDCIMDTEDDCLAIRAMSRWNDTAIYDTPAVCENIAVSNCVLKSQCQGIRIGCPGDGEIRNCAFTNLVIESHANGITLDNPRRYLPEGTSGTADLHDMVFSNITITCRNYPINLHVEEGIRLARFSDLTFSNFRIRSGACCRVEGSPETTIRNIAFNDIDLATSGTEALRCIHCENIRMNNVNVSNR